jgi:hypothetical protein
MLTRVHFSEVELARVVCEKLQPGARVMIGGLGLGMTAHPALLPYRSESAILPQTVNQSN